MNERRQAFKKDPIEIDLGGNKVISVGPIPWEAASAFGDEVIRQNVEIINEAVKMYTDPESNIPQLEARLTQKWSDPRRLLQLGLEVPVFEELNEIPLHLNQIAAILIAICEVNELHQLMELIDPKLASPANLGGLVSVLTGMRDDSEPTASGPDSSSPASTEPVSEPSLVPNSTES